MSGKLFSVMQVRIEFIKGCTKGEKSISQLCREYGISRKTGHKWIKRFEETGNLEQLPRRPNSPHGKTEVHIEAKILDVRCQYPTWGPKKISAFLIREGRGEGLPSVRTIATILQRHGLVVPRKARRRCSPNYRLFVPESSNDLFSIDFKGWFRMGNGHRCEPLTLIDTKSRYLVLCKALCAKTDAQTVIDNLIDVFREQGTPRAILSDNGPPFGSTGGFGITRYSVFLLRLGILPLRINPGKPQENGILERLHRTLKQDVLRKVADTVVLQQRAFDEFQRVYNDIRPHEALDMGVPSDLYERSSREYPETLPALLYDEGFEVRPVSEQGRICWKGEVYQLSTALAGEKVGLKLLEYEPAAEIYLGRFCLGTLNFKTRQRLPAMQQVSICTQIGEDEVIGRSQTYLSGEEE